MYTHTTKKKYVTRVSAVPVCRVCFVKPVDIGVTRAGF